MELPTLPPEFSPHARKRIIDTDIKASRAFPRSELRPMTVTSRHSGNFEVIHKYVLPVFLAFAEEACAMGHHPTAPWASDRIDKLTRAFLRRLLIGSQFEFNDPDYPVFRMTSEFGLIPEVRREIESSEQWTKYQDLLLEVEEPKSAAMTPAKVAAVPPRIGYRKEVNAWMKREHLDNLQIAARRLGISKSTLKSIMSDRGKVRYGPERLKAVLTAIGRLPKG